MLILLPAACAVMICQVAFLTKDESQWDQSFLHQRLNPADLSSLEPRAIRHEGQEKKKKKTPNSRQFFSLHSKQSSEKINMHSHRKNGLYSGNGRPNPFRSIIPRIDMEGVGEGRGEEARSGGRGPTA